MTKLERIIKNCNNFKSLQDILFYEGAVHSEIRFLFKRGKGKIPKKLSLPVFMQTLHRNGSYSLLATKLLCKKLLMI